MNDIGHRFFAAMGRLERLREIAHEDMRWVVPEGSIQHAGTHQGLEKIAAMMSSAVAGAFVPGSERIEFLNVAEGENLVMIEARMRAQSSKPGPDYDNGYVFVFELRDGKIQELREHVDTRYAASFYE